MKLLPLLALALLPYGSTLALSATAEAPKMPILWNENEQAPKPDLSGRERIRFLTTTDFRPFNFLDGNGRLSGFHVDLVRAICRELKMSDRCQIQAIPFSELGGALTAGQAEAIIAGISVTAENREHYAFTLPYLRFPGRFVASRALVGDVSVPAIFKQKRVGVVSGSAHERMLRDYFPETKPAPYPNAGDMLADLKANKIDGAFGDGMRLSFWLSGTDGAACCKFAGGPYLAPAYLGQGLAVAVRPDDTELARAFDYALREIGIKGVFAELYLRYFPVGFF